MKVSCQDLSGNKVLLHTLKHVLIAALLKSLLINLELSSVKTFFQLLEATLDLEDRTLSGLLLDSETIDLFLDFLKVILLGDHKLFDIIVLLFYLTELD